jgi:hypothetical protein
VRTAPRAQRHARDRDLHVGIRPIRIRRAITASAAQRTRATTHEDNHEQQQQQRRLL